MAKNTRVQLFRDSASDEQWKEVVSDHENGMSDRDFKEKYGFSWASIMNNAVDKGYYKKKRNSPVINGFDDSNNKVTPVSSKFYPHFNIDNDYPRGAIYISRSFFIREDIARKLKALEDDCEHFSKKHIFNQLLDIGLKHYGYDKEVDVPVTKKETNNPPKKEEVIKETPVIPKEMEEDIQEESNIIPEETVEDVEEYQEETSVESVEAETNADE